MQRAKLEVLCYLLSGIEKIKSSILVIRPIITGITLLRVSIDFSLDRRSDLQ